MPEGRDLAEAMRDRDYGSAASADIDVGMGGGGFTPVGDPRDFRAGPDVPDMPSPDVIAAIADQLNAAAAETQFGPGAAPNAVAVNQQGDRLSNAQVQALINLQDQYQTGLGETIPNTWDNPYVSQNYDDWGQGGTSNVNQTAISRALANQGPDPVETRRQELMAELDRLNTLSVQASNVTQPYPSSWSQPDEWGMENVQTGWAQDVLSQQGMPDPNARRSWEINNPSPLASSRPGPIASHFPSPLESSRPGPTQRELDTHYPSPLESSIPWSPEYDDEWGMQNVGLSPESISTGPYNQARTASLAFDEYDRPSRQQQEILSRPDEWGMEAYSPGSVGPQFDSTMGVGAGSFPEDIEDEWGMSDVRLDQETERVAAGIVAEGEGILQGSVKKADLEKVRTESDMDELVTEATKTLSKRLTKEEKEANVAARREAEKSYVAFRDTLNFRVEIARSALATAENVHGKKSPEAKAAKRNVRNKEADLRMWERSDLYIKSYGAGKNLPGVGMAFSALTGIENYFHSLGKTERRAPEDILKDMKKEPEKYERTGAEVSAAQLVRNMYPFLRRAPIDVAAAAAREPSYLRYLINLNVNKQPIPTSYSSNWKNDISDAWIYG